MLDVIGNNIANVNTIAFKSSRVTFKDMFSQMVKGSGAPDSSTGRGGTNPLQIGLGTGVGTVDTLFTRGSVQRTDNNTDLSIEGEGFFVVKGNSSDAYRYTRAGNFTVDKQGNFVASNGMHVYGWQYYKADPTNPGAQVFDTERNVEPINVYTDSYNGNKKIIAPHATDNVTLSGNLNMNNKNTDAPVIIPMSVYDAFGNEYKIEARFQKTAVDHVWNYTMTDTQTGASKRFADVTGTITFDNTAGKEGKPKQATGGTNVDTGLIRDITLGLKAVNSNLTDITMKVDLTKLTQYATDSSAKVYSSNGYNSGTLSTFSIGPDGVISGIYSNGQQQPLGLIALANFENPSGLQKVGENMYCATSNSGEVKKPTRPGGEGLGVLDPGTLEMSNVDLSQEFTEMITAQRGFQANSRIITTTDEILNELVNMKR
jgi:flagellar hook protein FlgE